MTQHAGRIITAGETHEVEFVPGDPALNELIDAAYREKHAGSPYLPPMVLSGPREATVEHPKEGRMKMVSYDFRGKVAFVTGASAGMGAATARAFAEAGAAVAVVDVNGEAAERFAAELSGEGHRALAVQCDVSSEAQVENAVARTV
jgi:hypothetical protein